MTAMVWKCCLVCVDHSYIGFCLRHDSSRDIFRLMNLRGSSFQRHQIDEIFFISHWKFASFFLVSTINLGAGLPNLTHGVFNLSWSFPKDLASSLISKVPFFISTILSYRMKKKFFGSFEFEWSSELQGAKTGFGSARTQVKPYIFLLRVSNCTSLCLLCRSKVPA